VGSSSSGEEEKGRLFPGWHHTAQHCTHSATITSPEKDIEDGQWGPVKQTGAERAVAMSLTTLLGCGVGQGPCTGKGEGTGFWFQCWHQDQHIQDVP